MYTTSPNVIETDDIAEVQQIGDARTLPDGRTALPVLLILGTDSDGNGKSYGPGSFPHTFHVTNGVNPRNLPILPHEGYKATPEVAPESTPDASSTDSDSSDSSDAGSTDGTKDEGKKGSKKKADASDAPPSNTTQE